MPDRYDLIVDVCNFLDWWHQTTKALIVSAGIGHEKLVQQAASKHVKVFNADEYFSHVFLEMDEFMRDW